MPVFADHRDRELTLTRLALLADLPLSGAFRGRYCGACCAGVSPEGAVKPRWPKPATGVTLVRRGATDSRRCLPFARAARFEGGF